MWWAICVLLCTGVSSVSSECVVGDFFKSAADYNDQLFLTWVLTEGSDLAHCSSVTVCLQPPDYPCIARPGHNSDYMTFYNLQSGQTYTANVTAIDVTGLVTSQVITDTTAPYRPSDVNIAGVTKHSVTLTIGEPCCNTVFDYYKIFTMIDNSGSGTSENATSTGLVTYHTVKNLLSATDYEFRVDCYSKGVVGEDYWLEATTDNGNPVTDPPIPECAVANIYVMYTYYESLEFDWTLTAGSDPGYCSSVKICIKPLDYLCNDVTGQTGGVAYFYNLQSGQTYNIIFKARDITGQVTRVIGTAGTTNAHGPSDVNIAGVTSSSVTLEIIKPCCDTIFDRYQVHYNIYGGPDDEYEDFRSHGNVTYHTVKSLLLATEYEFSVKTIGPDGRYGGSYRVFATTATESLVQSPNVLMTESGDIWIHPGARYYIDSGSSSRHGLSGVRPAALLYLVYWCLILW